MNIKWILNDGNKPPLTFSSFPHAFRSAWGIRHRALNPDKEKGEVGRALSDVMNSISILAPTGKKYSFFQAIDLAREQDLLDRDNQINSREFKKKR